MASPIEEIEATSAVKPLKHVYSIVQFEGNYKKPIVELVPQSWVRTIKGQMLCKYPPKKDHDNLQEWVTNCSPATESWRHYKVKVLQKAGYLAQGERRLARFQVTLQTTDSTEDEAYMIPNIDQPVPLSEIEETDLFSIPGHISSEAEDESSSSSSDDAVESSADEPELEMTPQRPEKRKPKSPLTSGERRVSRKIILSPSREKSTPKSYKRRRAMDRNDADEDSTSSAVASTPPPKKKTLPAAKTPQNPKPSFHKTSELITSGRVEQKSAAGINNTKIMIVPTDGANTPQPKKKNPPATNTPQTSKPSSAQLITPQTAERKSAEGGNIQTTVPPGASGLNVLNLEKWLGEKFEAMRRSLIFDVKKLFDDFKDSIKLANGAGFGQVVNIKRELGVNFPIETLTDFQAFDKRLTDKDVEALMMKLMSFWCSTDNVKTAVTSILSRIISQEVQLKYSGVGKMEGHGGKKNFSATNCFTCLHSTIRNRFENDVKVVSIQEITQLTTKWLATADDRKGGRKTRVERREAKKLVNNPEAAMNAAPAAPELVEENPVEKV